MASGQFSVSLQENLLVLLAFNERAGNIIRNAVDPKIFGSVHYREIVQRIYDFIDQYHKPPGDHLPDLLEDELASDKPSAKLYLELLDAIFSQRETINEKYTLDRLEAFVRLQTLKGSIIRATEAMQDEDLDKAEEHLNAGMKTRLSLFDPGMSLMQGLDIALAGQVRQKVIPTGIKGLDDANFGPGAGEFHLFLGPPKKGKSWWLVHMAKQCILHRHRVAVLTLELSQAQWTQRLLQNLFSLPRHKAKVPVSRFELDGTGKLLRITRDEITGRMALDDPHARRVLTKKLTRMYSKDNIVIKQFPAGQLTVRGISNYLDMLEQSIGFIPDDLIIDYPDYMEIDPANYRHESAALFNNLRGLAVQRNIAITVASKLNREGSKAKQSNSSQVGEDFSRIYTADSILVYSQTEQEKRLGLARLSAGETRVADRDGFTLVIAQAYPIGQFVLDSVYLSDMYPGFVENLIANEPAQGPTI